MPLLAVQQQQWLAVSAAGLPCGNCSGPDAARMVEQMHSRFAYTVNGHS